MSAPAPEKIDGPARNTVKEYKKDLLREQLDQELSEYDKECPARLAANEAAQRLYNHTAWEDRWPWDGAGPREPGTLHGPDVVRGLIEDYEADGLLDHRDGARDLLRELERIGFASDTWEWDLTDWSFHYLYACHSIVWAIAQYDAVKTVATKDGETHE